MIGPGSDKKYRCKPEHGLKDSLVLIRDIVPALVQPHLVRFVHQLVQASSHALPWQIYTRLDKWFNLRMTPDLQGQDLKPPGHQVIRCRCCTSAKLTNKNFSLSHY